jgi:transcription termination factor Rho
MSAAGFDMALLEGKDRAELAAIAEQLGQKPGARAKKADIVALIMRLVGADEGSSTADAGRSDRGAVVEGSDADAEAASGADAPGGGEPAPGAAAESSGEPSTDDTAESEATRSDAPSPADDSAGADTDQRADAGRSGGGRAGGRAPAGEASGEGTGDGDGNGNGNGNGDANGDDVEPGNRRRRRRGRDRDRRNEGEDHLQVEPVEVEGMVDLRDEGYGFLRLGGYLPSRDDAYISVRQTRQFGLRTGDIVGGKSRAAARNERNPALVQVDTVNGHPAHNQPARPRFEDLTPLFPDERLTLELADDPTNLTVRIIDLLAPVGKGTRGLIVSPPKAGKTTIVKHVVRSVEVNHPEVELLVVLVDERPEEVTDMKRWLLRGSVAASTFDRPPEEHIAVAELVIERAKRMVEDGRDVVVVLDGITRLARAYNLAAPASGRTMAGGIETSALYPPKKFFGAARNAEEGGSLTILATALVETNTRADEVIFEEFKGTGNMELRLDRRLAERRVYPAIDVDGSSTRHEELLFERSQLAQVTKLRRVLGGLKDETGSGAAGLEMLTDRLGEFRTNAEFLAQIAKG